MDDLVAQIAEHTGLALGPAQVAALAAYERELLAWNARFNLTAIRDVAGIRTKHILDSLTCVRAWEGRRVASLIDVGSGAGFPGLALKIARPELQVVLVESVGKKADFCRHVIHTLGLAGAAVITARAEELGRDPVHRERYDCAVGRAVALMPVLAEYLLPLVRVGGCMVAMKGAGAAEETRGAAGALRVLGGGEPALRVVLLPGIPEPRYLVVVPKEQATPPRYPRGVGVPATSPLAAHAADNQGGRKQGRVHKDDHRPGRGVRGHREQDAREHR